VLDGEAHRVMAASDLVLVASGTATLEAACYGTPMVVLYRLSGLSYVVARAMVRGVSHIALPNIIAGRGVVTELIQGRATGDALAVAAGELLDDPGARAAQRAALAEVRARLGDPGAATRAAEAVLREAETAGPARLAPGPAARRRRWRDLGRSSVVVALGRIAVRLLGASLRVVEVRAAAVDALWAARRPVIYVMWHGRVLMMPYLYGHRRVHVLTSRARDGELLSRFVQGFGLRVVRGSSSRGGAQALRGLARALRQDGAEAFVVPDGPRGPRGVVQPGVVFLAKLTGVPVVPIGFGASRCTVFGSWDRFQVPHPFARAAVVFGEPIRVEPDADDALLARRRREVEAALDRVNAEADRLAGRGRVLAL
jgi:hypothetical protein